MVLASSDESIPVMVRDLDKILTGRRRTNVSNLPRHAACRSVCSQAQLLYTQEMGPQPL